jgi:hypothetical protein
MASENSINYALRIIKPILDGNANAVDLKPAAEEAFSQDLQAAHKDRVWYTGCSTWYVRHLPNGKTWNAMVYPWTQAYFWYRSLFPVWSDLDYLGLVKTERGLTWWGLAMVGGVLITALCAPRIKSIVIPGLTS